MAATLSSEAISEVMNTTGPTVSAVFLKADGTVEQITIDTSPKVNAAASLLKGNPTFIGQWPSLNVVIMCSKVTADDWPVNQHKLPPPFSKAEVKGDILLLRVDDDAVPADFALDEWERFTAERDEASASADEEDCGPLQISANELIDQIDEADDDEEDEEFEAEEDESDEDDSEDDYDEDEQDDEDEADMDQDDSPKAAEGERSEQ